MSPAATGAAAGVRTKSKNAKKGAASVISKYIVWRLFVSFESGGVDPKSSTMSRAPFADFGALVEEMRRQNIVMVYEPALI